MNYYNYYYYYYNYFELINFKKNLKIKLTLFL